MKRINQRIATRELHYASGEEVKQVATGGLITVDGAFLYLIYVDLSVLALQEARRKLGDDGIYLLADVTCLPLKAETIDTVISLHAIYHGPEDEQRGAIEELYRVTKPDSPVAIVYTWGNHSVVRRMAGIIRRVGWLLRAPFGYRNRVFWRLSGRAAQDSDARDTPGKTEITKQPELYFHAHNYRFFKKQDWDFPIDVLVWESIESNFTRRFVSDSRAGRYLLLLIYRLEDWFPRLLGRLGQYPLLLIKKRRR